MLTSATLARDVYVRGYTKSNGTNVDGYYRTAPDSNRNNNYSTSGNTNPHTGVRGSNSYNGTCTSLLNC
jgi:hypothetical protein